MSDGRRPRRRAAEIGQQISRTMLGQHQTPAVHVGKTTLEEDTDNIRLSDPDEDRNYRIETWWFDKEQQGFASGRLAIYPGESIQSSDELRKEAQWMWAQERMLVRFVVSTTERHTTTHAIAGQDASLEGHDAVQHYFSILQQNPAVAKDKTLRIVFHEPTESSAFTATIRNQGFKVYASASWNK